MKNCNNYRAGQNRRGPRQTRGVMYVAGALFIYLFLSCTPCLNKRTIFVYKTIPVYDTVIYRVYDTLTEYKTINVYDTIVHNIYDTTDIVNIEDCIYYKINVSAMDSAPKAEMNKVFNEFIRKLNTNHFK